MLVAKRLCSEASFDLRSAGYEVCQVFSSKQITVTVTEMRLCLSNLNVHDDNKTMYIRLMSPGLWM